MTLRETFKSIADAIRAKGVSGTFKPIEMASKIGDIQSGLDFKFLVETGYPSIINDDTLTYIRTTAFPFQDRIKELHGANIGWIGQSAFWSCPNGIEVVDCPKCSVLFSGAFRQCSKLRQINMPLVQRISSQAFWGCQALTALSFPLVSSMESSPFMGCASVSTAYFPQVKSLPYACFSGCKLLTEVTIPQCTYIASYAFSGCSSLSTISLPLVSFIGSTVFNSTKITRLDLPELTSCATTPFFGMSSLLWLSCPKLTSWFSMFSSSCKSLSWVNAKACRWLGNAGGFSYTAIYSAYLPNCSYFGMNCFFSCSNLSQVYALSTTVPSAYSTAFGGWPKSTTASIFVRASLVDAFKTASYWSVFSNRIIGLTDEEIAVIAQEYE